MGRKQQIAYIKALRERLERDKLHYEPSPPQEQFHKSDRQIRLMIGGNQTGKTLCTTREFAWIVTETHPYMPNIKTTNKVAWLVAVNKSDVTNILWENYLKKFIPERYIKRIVNNGSVLEKIELTNGWTIMAKSYGQKREGLQGAPCDLILVDEMPDVEEWEEIYQRVQATKGQIIISFTPLKVNKKIKSYMTGENSKVETFKLTKWDNPVMDNDELDKEIEGLPENVVKIRYLGEWASYAGKLFTAFNTEDNVVDAFAIPDYWRRCVTIDPATSSDTGVNWIAENPDNGLWFVYREALLKGLAPSDLLAEILKRTGNEKIAFWYVDQQAAYLVAEAIKLGIALIGVKKANMKEIFVNNLNQAFRSRQLFIMRNCKETADQLAEYANDPKTEEFKPIKHDDHLVDDLLYFWQGRPYFQEKAASRSVVQKYIDSILKNRKDRCHDATLGYI